MENTIGSVDIEILSYRKKTLILYISDNLLFPLVCQSCKNINIKIYTWKVPWFFYFIFNLELKPLLCASVLMLSSLFFSNISCLNKTSDANLFFHIFYPSFPFFFLFLKSFLFFYIMCVYLLYYIFSWILCKVAF